MGTITPSTLSFSERVSENFTNHKWEIIAPGPMGLAALVGTIVFFVSNPFGWMISAGLVGASIAFAGLSAVGAIGFSLYHLLKEPDSFKNSFTYELVSPQSLLPPAKEQPLTEPEVIKEVEKPVQAAALKPRRKKKVTFAPEPTLYDRYLDIKQQTPVIQPGSRIKAIARKIFKGALLLGGLCLGVYGLHSYLNPTIVTMSPAPLSPLAKAAAAYAAANSATCPNLTGTCPIPLKPLAAAAAQYAITHSSTCANPIPPAPPINIRPPTTRYSLASMAQYASLAATVLLALKSHFFL